MEPIQSETSNYTPKTTTKNTSVRNNSRTLSRNTIRNQQRSEHNSKRGARTEEDFRIKFLDSLNKKPNITTKEFLLSLNEEEQKNLKDIATEKLINVWRVNNQNRTQKTERFVQAKERVKSNIQIYFSLHEISPLGKKWGELTGNEWGTIGNRGMAARKLLGMKKTAFSLVGSDQNTCDEKFNKLLGSI